MKCAKTGRREWLIRLCGVLTAVFWLLALATGITRLFAGSPAVLEAAMRRYAPPEQSGLPETEYPGMAGMIAGYLAGRETAFQYRFTDPAGGEAICFQSHEAAHMADCRALIALDTRVCIASLAAGGAFLLAGWFLAKRRGLAEFRRGMRVGMLMVGIVLAVLLLWAVLNFNGFFITFHRLAFTNDGWMLNPRTDLLIRLMPAVFFIRLGIAGLALFLAGTVGLYLASVLPDRRVVRRSPT